MKLNFVELLKVQSYSGQEYKMVHYIEGLLTKMQIPYKYDEIGNIIAMKGNGKIGLVAHTDTVHEIFEGEMRIIYSKGTLKAFKSVIRKNKIKNVITGIGGDDKVGIFLVLRLLQELNDVTAFFVTQEEIGSVGALYLNRKYLEPCSYFIEIDRRGIKDVVTQYYNSDLINSEFKKKIKPILKKHNRVEASGLTTDIIALAEAGSINVSAINVSCGYYNPHTAFEYISIDEVNKTYQFVKDLIVVLGTKRYEHKYESYSYSYSKWWEHYYNDDTYEDDRGYLYDNVDDDDDEDLKNYAKWSKIFQTYGGK